MSALRISFRDPAGCCVRSGGRVFRLVRSEAVRFHEENLATRELSPFVLSGSLNAWRRLTSGERDIVCALPEVRDRLAAWPDAVVGEHPRIPFPSYPHEWPPEMLWEAAVLTLELAQAALAAGLELKDATPDNIMFRGSKPVFLDMTSFEKRATGRGIWGPYAQFVRTFLLPLVAERRWGVSLRDVFVTRRDGLSPHEVYGMCSWRERFVPPLLSLVSLPVWLERFAERQGAALFEGRRLPEEQAVFILQRLFKRWRRDLDALSPHGSRPSLWGQYMATHGYAALAFAAKEAFVAEVLDTLRPGFLLDAGANTGHFSRMAAHRGASVVSIDTDPRCVGRMFQQARRESLDLLPLVVDLARPSAALGWENSEAESFLERAQGSFDGVLMLALLHHLLVSERVPLPRILGLLKRLTRSWAVVEFVEPSDPMFRQLARGRDALYADLSVASFEAACCESFRIVRALPIPGMARHLYLLERKDSSL